MVEFIIVVVITDALSLVISAQKSNCDKVPIFSINVSHCIGQFLKFGIQFNLGILYLFKIF